MRGEERFQLFGCVSFKSVAVSDICLPVYSDLISCEGEIAQVHVFLNWWQQYRKLGGMK